MTDAPEMDDDLPELTDQQMRFVECILGGMSSSDAYRSAYNATNMLDRTIWAAASRLRSDCKVATWLSAARKAGLGRAAVTLEGHLAELERLREIAIDSGNVGAAVQAEQLRGKASNHYSENIRLETVDPTNVLDEIRKLNPALADQLAGEHMGAEYHGETLQ
jgi:hypothetical protein